jgi:hypothetical protein
VIRLDAATVLLQWAVGGLAFLWVTTRHRQVGLGYGWLVRGTNLVLAAGALLTGVRYRSVPGREVAAAATVVAIAVALGLSIARKSAGVRGQTAEHDRRSGRVAAMTGIVRAGVSAADDGNDDITGVDAAAEADRRNAPSSPRSPSLPSGSSPSASPSSRRAEFPPVLDLVAAAVGVVGLVAAGIDAGHGGGGRLLAVARTLAGAAFLGAVTDAMLLGHWYLVQPGLPRRLLLELVRWLARVWPFEVALLLVPTGMVSVLNGRIDDGWNGTLGWFWVACALTTIALCAVTRAALRERQYSAVMAATGLLYLAILTAFGTDLVARAVLSG